MKTSGYIFVSLFGLFTVCSCYQSYDRRWQCPSFMHPVDECCRVIYGAFRIDGFDTIENHLTAIIPLADRCTEGQLEWHMSTYNSLILTRTDDSPFSLCIVHTTQQETIGAIREVTGGLDNQLNRNITNNPACIDSMDGQAALRVDTPGIYYINTIFYTFTRHNY